LPDVTRRIDEDFRSDAAAQPVARPVTGTVARGAAVGAPGTSRGADDREGPPSSSTAKWTPHVHGVAPEGGARGRAPRPRFSATLALWASGAPCEDQPSITGPDELRDSLLCQVGSLDHIPRSGVASHEIGSLGLEHRLAFMLSLVDGVSTVAEVVDVCGLDELEALALLADLGEQGLVAFFRPRA
jgi:hypothetical protein